MLDRDKFIEELKQMFNDICVLYDHELVRLIGFYEDEMDYYYHVRQSDGKDLYASAVGALVSMKDIYPADRYEHMDNVFHMNHCHRADQFSIGGGSDVKCSWEVIDDSDD